MAIAGADASAARLAAGVAALAHRGPDGRGVWTSPDGRIGLGHARLAVIDPAGGAQPVHGASTVAVVNGELYGYEEQARWLAARGVVMRSRCDSEVLVHLYEALGDDFVRAARGELAFVLWDERNRRLLAGRDRFGIKPLVWARWQGGIAIASEAKALFAMGVPARWDAEAFAHAAQTQYVWPDRTLFEGVQQVPPGCVLSWNAGRDAGCDVSVRRYWEFPREAPRISGLGEAAEAFGAAIDDAVRVRMRADAPVCVQLSGGVDSTAVAALAARAGGLAGAFTVGFAGGGAHDERASAAATASALGVPHTVIELDGAAIAAHWPAAVVQGEGLAINGHLVAKWMLSRAMRDAGMKVALTGEGADEILAGYPHLRVDAGVAITGHAASRGVMLPSGAGLSTDGVAALLGCVPTWIAAKATLGLRVRGLLAPDLVRQFGGSDPLAALVERLGGAALRGRPALHIGAITWSGSAMAQYILRTLGDGMEMAHGIEGRVPFLDHRVVELAFAIDPAVLAGGELDKPVLRQALGALLPEAVARRPKHPFLAPPLSRLAPALVQDTLRSYALRSPLIDRGSLLAVLDALPAMSEAELQAWDAALMLVLSAAILEGQYCR